MDGMEVPFGYKPLHPPPREAELQQLRHRHDAVLGVGQPGKEYKLGAICATKVHCSRGSQEKRVPWVANAKRSCQTHPIFESKKNEP
jgi:hypothetical protein